MLSINLNLRNDAQYLKYTGVTTLKPEFTPQREEEYTKVNKRKFQSGFYLQFSTGYIQTISVTTQVYSVFQTFYCLSKN